MMSLTSDAPAVVVRRFIRAPVSRVFAAWTDPRIMEKWMTGCDGASKSRAEADVRVGGAFRIVMDTKGGDVDHTGVYREIRRDERLAFTWRSRNTDERDTEVEVDFRAIGGGTEILIQHRQLPTDQAIASHAGGWGMLLRRLDGHVAADGTAADDGLLVELPLRAAPAAVYAALTTAEGLRAWWTPTCEVGSGVGAMTTFRFGTTWKTFRIELLKPEAEVRWRCLAAHIAAPGIARADEWVGTALSFAIEARPEGSLLRFEHRGLQPQLSCFELCTAGWKHCLGSLKSYVETGAGSPCVSCSSSGH